jgi:hypothetical protein
VNAKEYEKAMKLYEELKANNFLEKQLIRNKKNIDEEDLLLLLQKEIKWLN